MYSPSFSSWNESPVAVTLYTLSAFIAVLVFATTATQQLQTFSSSHSSAPVTTATSTIRSLQPSSLLRVPRHQTKETTRQAQVDLAESYEATAWHRATVPQGACAMASLCVGGLLGFLWGKTARRTTPLAMLSVTGVRRTMAETKMTFLRECDASIPNMYNIPLQELLAQHHLIRYNTKYSYDEVFALGIVTVLTQLLEGLPEDDMNRILRAYFVSLNDDVDQFKRDAAMLEGWAAAQGKDMGLAGDDEVTGKLRGIAERVAGGQFQYSKFFSIGVFQLLQQAGQTDPEKFMALVSGMNLDKERVTKDLKVYKDLLKRLEMAKDMKEKFLERERRKQQERLAKKNAAAL